MTTILALDASHQTASVALLHNGKEFERTSSGVSKHSQEILPMVQSVLKEAGINLQDCSAISYGAGPGSFTGVRTACGVVQGLAFGANLPVVPVGTLEAMAQACYEKHNAKEVLIVVDALMNEVYWAQYRYLDGWTEIVKPTLSAPQIIKVSAAADGEKVYACGNGLEIYASELKEKFSDLPSDSTISSHALYIARIGADIFLKNGAIPAKEAQPVYLRNKVALTIAERELKNKKGN